MAKSVKGGSDPSTLLDILRAALVGKYIEHTNQYGRTVTLKVEDVKIEHRSWSREIEPASSKNDWWPTEESKEWDEISITFEDGSSISKDWRGEFKIVYPKGGQISG